MTTPINLTQLPERICTQLGKVIHDHPIATAFLIADGFILGLAIGGAFL
jgi:hypothetical protein